MFHRVISAISIAAIFASACFTPAFADSGSHPIVTIFVPGLGKTVTAPLGVRIAPVAPTPEDDDLVIHVPQGAGVSWRAAMLWSDEAFPIDEITVATRNSDENKISYTSRNFVVAVPGRSFAKGFEYLGSVLNNYKMIYKFDGYEVVPQGRVDAQDALTTYLYGRQFQNKSPYMYIEFFDLSKNDGRAYSIDIENDKFSKGAMIIPLAPLSPAKLAFRNRIAHMVEARQAEQISKFFQGELFFGMLAATGALSHETIGQRMMREHDECVRASGHVGAIC